MINKTKGTKGQSLFDILDARPHRMDAIYGLTFKQLSDLHTEIGQTLFHEDVSKNTKNGVHPTYGKIK